MNPLLQPGLHGAFVANGFAAQLATGEGADPAPLAGVRLAVKDVFDIAGLVCSAGNPTWASAQPEARRHATAVAQLLDGGCEWVGKTVTDELTYSLAGINVHYGTPVNPRAPHRLPGGSSSGSAVAVAAGHAQLALGTDCGGSVRLPASYCGIWGMRPSHGRIATDGCFTLAHSLDTVGWFADRGELLERGFMALGNCARATAAADVTLIVSADICDQLDPAVRAMFEQCLHRLDRPLLELPRGTLALEDWAHALRVVQGAEVWQQHRHWLRANEPAFGTDVAQRFNEAGQISGPMVAAASLVRAAAIEQMGGLLGNKHMLLLPPVPGVAPLLGDAPATVQNTRTRSQRLLCIAGLCGLPQVVLPWRAVDQAPIGLSLIGPRFADEHVLANALSLYHKSIAAHPDISYASHS
ncbi:MULTISPECIES: amidase [Pseudomonas]|uniref:2-amino-5-chloromuconic acid deaminase n=1 Tax=Pseudomonas fluorescens TaxID=294 RepID=A0A5E6SRP9_PSEFL|nr:MULTISPECIES: amidase [Pseudomonas]VVM83230.1 2-amino-5-chloromuconic acid deaminase [Pseudomonas fluorescens]